MRLLVAVTVGLILVMCAACAHVPIAQNRCATAQSPASGCVGGG